MVNRDMGRIIRNCPNTLDPADKPGKAAYTFYLIGITISIVVKNTQSSPCLDGSNLAYPVSIRLG
jgi:hypothetical protein